MKRRYKLLIIIGVGIAITLFISNLQGPSKTTLTAIGDSFSLGMTPYKIPGASFNDYLKEYILKRNDLENYNDEFSVLHLRVKDLNDYLDRNVIGKRTHQPLKQIIDKSDIVTIAIGMDEFVEKSLIDKISEDDINNYIKDMDKFLKNIRDFYNKKLIVIGLYKANNFLKKDVININNLLTKLCGTYNVTFIDVLPISLKEDYYLDTNSYYLNYKAHKKIAKYLYEVYKNI